MTHNHDGRPADDPINVGNDSIIRWLLMVAGLVVGMIVVGGFVRLSRAGLSIVEWNVVSGVLPPIGDAAWEASFAEYQQSPEYRLVNYGMSLSEFQRIFYIEWAHRLIARIAGLLVVLPLLWFLWKRTLTPRESLRYWAVAVLFGVQGAIGWAMVSSGLVDRPVVSHFRLTIHLLLALALLGLVLWMALGLIEVGKPGRPTSDQVGSLRSRILAWVLLGTVVLQIAYGGLVAGLRAGYISDTWPLMFGRLVPSNLLTASEPWWSNFYESLGSHWIHRWFAFVVAALALSVHLVVRKDVPDAGTLRASTRWLLFIVAVQIAMGVGVVLFGVPTWLALAHQANGVALFCISIFLAHGLQARRKVEASSQVFRAL